MRKFEKFNKIVKSGMLIACTFTITQFTPLVCPVSAAGPCGDYDYSELKEMSKQELLDTYCKELDTTQVYMRASLYGNHLAGKNFESCASIVDKIERVYMKKTGNTITHDQLMGICKDMAKKND